MGCHCSSFLGISLSLLQDGNFAKFKDGNDNLLPERTLKKTFCNYFSFGIDGKIGYSFDKYRTKNRYGNYAVYGAVGALNQITKNATIDELVKHLYITIEPENPQYTDYGHSIFNSKEIVNKWHPLMNILALNIDSYTGGTSGIWKNGKQLFKKE